jgi:hypothetical protein
MFKEAYEIKHQIEFDSDYSRRPSLSSGIMIVCFGWTIRESTSFICSCTVLLSTALYSCLYSDQFLDYLFT